MSTTFSHPGRGSQQKSALLLVGTISAVALAATGCIVLAQLCTNDSILRNIEKEKLSKVSTKAASVAGDLYAAGCHDNLAFITRVKADKLLSDAGLRCSTSLCVKVDEGSGTATVELKVPETPLFGSNLFPSAGVINETGVAELPDYRLSIQKEMEPRHLHFLSYDP